MNIVKIKSITFLICLVSGLLLFEFSYIFESDNSGKDFAGPSVAVGHAYFTEAFPSQAVFKARWILSKSKKNKNLQYEGVWKVEEPWSNPLYNDFGLVLKTKSKHHAVSAMLDEPFIFSDKTFVIQYEVKFQNGQSCGGAYIKLLSQTKELDLTQFNDSTQYTIMFGPDMCGSASKIHFIMQHRNPLTGLYEEKKLKDFAKSIDSSLFDDKKTHLYRLVIQPNNLFEIFIDQDLHFSGDLLRDMSPPINPPKEILDRFDRKPKDWDDRKQIPDPDIEKPADWDESEPIMIVDRDAFKPIGWLDDEPLFIPDPKVKKPADWDARLKEWEHPRIRNPKCVVGCGTWNPPMHTNPKYRGPWVQPLIDNPNYKGEWRPRMLPNEKYFEDLHPYQMTAIAAIGLELWSVSKDILFDNFIITDDVSVADTWAEDSWVLKQTIEMEQPQEQEPGFYRTMVETTEDQPYLWSFIAVLVVVPGLSLIYFCWSHGPNVYAEYDDGLVGQEQPIPGVEKDGRSADDAADNKDAGVTEEASDGGDRCDARFEAGNDDASGAEAKREAVCEENVDIGRERTSGEITISSLFG